MCGERLYVAALSAWCPMDSQPPASGNAPHSPSSSTSGFRAAHTHSMTRCAWPPCTGGEVWAAEVWAARLVPGHWVLASSFHGNGLGGARHSAKGGKEVRVPM